MSIFKKVLKIVKQPTTIVGIGLVATLFGADPHDVRNVVAATGILMGGDSGAAILQNAGILLAGGLIAHDQTSKNSAPE